MTKTFYSNGKLLLSGEYLVLDGAEALALPSRYGQDLKASPISENEIRWTSLDQDGTVWFETVIPVRDILDSHYSVDDGVKANLIKILHEAHILSPYLGTNGFEVETRLTFPRFWGLGTSSTLISNVAKWTGANPYLLSAATMGGSGYDIACASHDEPFIYKLEDGKPQIKEVRFNPVFKEHLYFVYLNKKQNSRSAVAAYYDKRAKLSTETSMITSITSGLVHTRELFNFTALLDEHERIMSNILDLPTIKEMLFKDFKGSIKSLGAWGGDFVLAVSRENPTPYFHKKGYETIIPYTEMLIK